MKFISLFAGIGGFDLALTRQGHECVWANEWDKYAAQIYDRHFNRCSQQDIRTVLSKGIPEAELLVGGFPCQAFSIAGLRKGFDDTRGTLFFEVARILKDKHPRLFILENVKGLLSHDNGNTFKTIISTLDELGYDLQWQVLNSKNFGVPQNRERVFIIGNLRGTSRPEVFPVGEGNGLDKEAQQKDGKEIQTFRCLEATEYKGYSAERFDGVLQGSIRRLTPIECERLQGFPDNWTAGVSDTQRYKMCGNAVTVNVVNYLVSKL